MTTSQNSIANPIETSSDWLLKIPSLSQQQSILVSPGGTGTVTSYSLVYDVYFPTNGSSGWMPFLQTDIGNSNDADIFGKASGESYGVGIGGVIAARRNWMPGTVSVSRSRRIRTARFR